MSLEYMEWWLFSNIGSVPGALLPAAKYVASLAFQDQALSQVSFSACVTDIENIG